MPSINRILETAIYCDNLDRAEAFYTSVLGLQVMIGNERLRALNANGQTVLLLFQRGGTLQPIQLPGGLLPAHDGSGPSHFAFAISAADYDSWKQKLTEQGVAIESEVLWPAGGRSIYFRDPDGHSVELATPGVWPIY